MSGAPVDELIRPLSLAMRTNALFDVPVAMGVNVKKHMTTPAVVRLPSEKIVTTSNS
jgi:hypothetical protein